METMSLQEAIAVLSAVTRRLATRAPSRMRSKANSSAEKLIGMLASLGEDEKLTHTYRSLSVKRRAEFTFRVHQVAQMTRARRNSLAWEASRGLIFYLTRLGGLEGESTQEADDIDVPTTPR